MKWLIAPPTLRSPKQLRKVWNVGRVRASTCASIEVHTTLNVNLVEFSTSRPKRAGTIPRAGRAADAVLAHRLGRGDRGALRSRQIPAAWHLCRITSAILASAHTWSTAAGQRAREIAAAGPVRLLRRAVAAQWPRQGRCCAARTWKRYYHRGGCWDRACGSSPSSG